MSIPKFEVTVIGKNCYAVNDHGRTVATVSSQGNIDWLLKSPLQDGPLVKSIRKETHLAYTLGFKIQLTTPRPNTKLTEFSYSLKDGGAALLLNVHGESKDGAFVSDTIATLRTDPKASRYEWDLETTIICTAKEPQKLKNIEYTNVYPAKAGLCMFHTPTKEYNCTLMTDKDGVIWNFPHQHTMHYGPKISRLQFAKGTISGSFGEKTGSPVVIVNDANTEPFWGICDMYYDLHCQARLKGDIQPGEKLHFAYTIKYLNHADSEKMLKASRPVPVSGEDLERHDDPRFELGMNRFTDRAKIDRLDDASCFRQKPPQKVWDRKVGHKTKGSLRITNEVKEETVWGAAPPSHIPPETRLRVSAMVKTQGVEGKGMFIRLKYSTFDWNPLPRYEPSLVLESDPVSGTTEGWVRVEVPELRVPKKDFDCLLRVDVILDGKGVAWLTDVDVDLQPAPEQPALKESVPEKNARNKQAVTVASSSRSKDRQS